MTVRMCNTTRDEKIRIMIRPERTYGHIIHFFFNDTATTEIYTLSLHDALPISELLQLLAQLPGRTNRGCDLGVGERSEEHTSELQSPCNIVCRLLLEKKTISCSAISQICPSRRRKNPGRN